MINPHMTDRINNQTIQAALLLLSMAFFRFFPEQAYAKAVLQEVQAIKVSDGDTVSLMIKGKIVKTRLIGIDAPEMGQRPWGKQAKDRLIDIMNHAEWTVLMETDVVKNDKFGRPLVYLWTKQNELINERMVLEGQALLFIIPPNVKYANRLRKAEQRSRQEKKGIWGLKGLKENPARYREKHPRK